MVERRYTPLNVGVPVAVGFVVAVVAAEALLGRFDLVFGPGRHPGVAADFWKAILHALLAGYLPGAFLYVHRSARHAVAGLGPALDMDFGEHAERVRKAGSLGRRGLVVAGMIGLVITVAGPLLAPHGGNPWDPRLWHPEVAWHRILGPWIGFWTGALVTGMVVESRRLHQLAGHVGAVDPLDPSDLEPFVRFGLDNALAAAGFLALGALFLVDRGQALVVAFVGAITLVAVTFALVPSFWRVRQKLRQAKEAELARVADEIRAIHAAIAANDPSVPQGRLADLVAYRRMIEDVRTVPLGGEAFVRAGVYVLIPVASWLGARLIEAVLSLLF